jgi:hypothetical protein
MSAVKTSFRDLTWLTPLAYQNRSCFSLLLSIIERAVPRQTNKSPCPPGAAGEECEGCECSWPHQAPQSLGPAPPYCLYSLAIYRKTFQHQELSHMQPGVGPSARLSNKSYRPTHSRDAYTTQTVRPTPQILNDLITWVILQQQTKYSDSILNALGYTAKLSVLRTLNF